MITSDAPFRRGSSVRRVACRALTVGAVTLTSAGLVLALAPAANASTPAIGISTPLTGSIGVGTTGITTGSSTGGGVTVSLGTGDGSTLPTTGLSTITTPVTGVLSGATGTTGTSSTNLGIGTITTGTGGLTATVPVLQTTVGVTTSNGVGVTTAIGTTAVDASLGSTGTDPSVQQNLVVNPTVATSSATGTPGAVGIHLWADTAFPYKDGFRDSFPVSISAVDTDGSTLPIHGTVVVTSGSASDTTSFSDASGMTTVAADATNLPVGAGNLTVNLFGPNSTTPVTSSNAVTLASTDLTGLVYDTTAKTVYPVKDGYKDSTILMLKGATSTGTTLPTSGTAKLYKASKLVKTWKLDQSTTKITWNGRIGKLIKAGKYLLKVAMAGPQGAVKKLTESLSVSKQYLVTKVATFSITDPPLKKAKYFKSHSKLDVCTLSFGLTCVGASKTETAAASRLHLRTYTLPAAVKSGRVAGTAVQMQFVNRVVSLKGKVTWIYADGISKALKVRNGTHNSPWYTLKKGKSVVQVFLQLGKNSISQYSYPTIRYRYKKLS